MAQLVLKNILAGSGNVLAGGDNAGNVTKVTIGSNLTLSGGVLSATGGGSGSVTSVAMTVPTGLSITGSPITSSGTLALSYASGYSIPTTIKQSNWDDAYTWVAGFPSQTGNAGKYLTTNGSTLSWATITSSITGSGATNYIAKWSSASSVTNSLIYDSGSQVGINTTNLTSLLDVTKNALGVTVVDNSGITLKNETEAITNNQQISPALHFESNGWSTTALASQSTDFIMYNLPVQGTNPSNNLIFASSVNGAAYTTRATLTSAGGLTITGGLSATTGAFSSTLSAVTTATLTRTALTTTSTDGVIVQNTTAALVGTQVQMSPRIRLSGTAWNTGGTPASNTLNWVIQNLPTAGNPPTSTLQFAYYDTVNATVTNKFTLTNAGNGVFSGTLSASNLSGINSGDVTIGTANGLSLSVQAISLGLSSTSSTGALSSTDWNTFNGKQNAITLTTTGSSGSATFVSNTLNIPTYTLAGLGGQAQLNGTGFVKVSGTSVSYDNSTYLTTSSAASTYLPLTGGTLSGTLTATGFFESSDKRLKKQLEANYAPQNIGNIQAYLYEKDGKIEAGYYAQEVLEIIPSAVSEGKDGFLTVAYNQVMVAKIQYLENKLKQLEHELGRNSK